MSLWTSIGKPFIESFMTLSRIYTFLRQVIVFDVLFMKNGEKNR